MLGTRCTTADADHQADSDLGKTAEHVSRDTSSGRYAVLAVGKDGSDDIGFPDLAQSVVVIVVVDTTSSSSCVSSRKACAATYSVTIAQIQPTV